jgi:hypothetical protein
VFATTPPHLAATDSALAAAARALDRAIDAPQGQGPSLDGWRRLAQGHLADLRAALSAEAEPADDGWLAARRGGLLRERDALVARSAGLLGAVLGTPDVERLRADLRRFLADVGHHLQRRHDLAYDSVELELGGSE